MEVGTEKNCHLKSLESDVCNGPLAPGKTYRYDVCFVLCVLCVHLSVQRRLKRALIFVEQWVENMV